MGSRQNSFAGGEVSPSLNARRDSQRYNEAARTLKNFFVSPTGAAKNRAGTKYVCAVKDHTRKVRLVRFTFSDSQTYVIEFGHLYVRFISLGAQLLDGGNPYEVPSPYAEADLPKLKFAQVADVLVITHASYETRELKRSGHTSWAFSTVSYDPPAAAFPEFTPALLNPPSSDASHPLREWIYWVTSLQRRANGQLYESAPFQVTQKFTGYTGNNRNGVTPLADNQLCVFPDKPMTLDFQNKSGVAWNGDQIVAHRVYRGRGRAAGYLGETTSGVFVDYGQEPDALIPPPMGLNPFTVFDSDGTTPIRTEEPAVVSYFEQRRVLAHTTERPAHLFLSRVDDYTNFDDRMPSLDDDAIVLEIASNVREEIRAIVPLEQLFLFTDMSVWLARGGGGGPMIPADPLPETKRIIGIGSSWLDPIVIRRELLFVHARGNGVERIVSEAESDDLTLLSTHLFAGKSITSWDYAEAPWSLIWAVRDDGTFLSLTYLPALDVVAWTQHETEGVVEDVCCVPEGAEDATYFVVRRTVMGQQRRYIERLASRIITKADPGTWIFLDCAITGTLVPGGTLVEVSGLDHLEGETVYLLADGVPHGPFEVFAGKIQTNITPGPAKIVVGLKYESDLELLPMPEGNDRQKAVSELVLHLEESRGVQVGQSFAMALDVWSPTAVGDTELKTDEFRLAISNDWNPDGVAVLRQHLPLPVTVLGITRKHRLGGE